MALSKVEQLKKFIRINQVQSEWRTVNERRNVVGWVNTYHLESLCKILGEDFFETYDFECWLQYGELAICFSDICEYLGITLESIFGKDPQK